MELGKIQSIVKKSAKKRKPTAKRKKSSKGDSTISTGWIVRAVIIITIFAVGLSIYFGIQTKRRYERTSAEQDQALYEQESQITLACSGLMPLPNGKYAIYYSNAEGTFKLSDFNATEEGALTELTGTALPTTFTAPGANEFQVKCLSSSGTETVFLKGDSIMTFVYKDSFAQARGSFVLATPSDKNSGNEVAGIWFGTRSATTTGSSKWTTSLDLPVPPEGWRYAAWLIRENKYYLIGRFTVTNQADDNNSYYEGSGPSVVGEDFLTAFAEQTEISDVRSDASLAVITLEPTWFSENSPFPVAVLAATIPPTAQPGVAIPLALSIDSSPYCLAR